MRWLDVIRLRIAWIMTPRRYKLDYAMRAMMAHAIQEVLKEKNDEEKK